MLFFQLVVRVVTSAPGCQARPPSVTCAGMKATLCGAQPARTVWVGEDSLNRWMDE